MMAAPDKGYRSGFVSLVGRPNVGKSTLLNAFLGEKMAIVSPKPQTTRSRVLGVLTRPDVQIAFLDTPGLHQPEHALGRHMVQVARAAIEEADVLVVIIDGQRGIIQEDEQVFTTVRQLKRQDAKQSIVLAINKVDIAKKPLLLPTLDRAAKMKLFDAFIPISAKTGDQLKVLLKTIIEHLPEGPYWYEPGQKTDQTPQQRITELIREQVLLATRQEVPHAVAVMLSAMEEKERVTVIQATILVERQGQKAIVIGKGGLMLKQIGQAARQELEKLLGRKVFLELWVKVSEDWRGNERILRDLGYYGDKY